METPSPVVISCAVEGIVDEAVLRRLVKQIGATLGPVYGKSGKPHLQKQIGGYNQAARQSPWVVLVDLDRDADCAPLLRASWLPTPAPNICFRVAVREVESWLLADHERLARFLGVARSKIPLNPEAVDDPKRILVELAKNSRRREIREDMVPRPKSGRVVGPAYSSRLIELVEMQWRPDVAAHNSDSLRRCYEHLHQLIKG